MYCSLRSADRILYQGDADQITARSPHGEFAVMNNHAPILAVLVPGVIHLRAGKTEHTFVCKGGTFDLVNNQVTILMERPFALEEINPVAIGEQLAALQSSGTTSSGHADEAAYLQLLCQVKENYG